MFALLCPVWEGPPYVSDDPQPTDYRHFEIYTFSNGTVTRDRTGGASGMTTMSGLLTNGFYAEVSGFGRD